MYVIVARSFSDDCCCCRDGLACLVFEPYSSIAGGFHRRNKYFFGVGKISLDIFQKILLDFFISTGLQQSLLNSLDVCE